MFDTFFNFWACFQISEKVVNSQFVDWFPLFCPFSHFLGPFSVFRKSFKFLVPMFDSTLKIILKNLKEYPVMKKISAYAKQSESGEFEGYLGL